MYSFSQRTMNEWNKSSTDCINARNMNMFKNKINKHLRRAGLTKKMWTRNESIASSLPLALHDAVLLCKIKMMKIWCSFPCLVANDIVHSVYCKNGWTLHISLTSLSTCHLQLSLWLAIFILLRNVRYWPGKNIVNLLFLVGKRAQKKWA